MSSVKSNNSKSKGGTGEEASASKPKVIYKFSKDGERTIIGLQLELTGKVENCKKSLDEATQELQNSTKKLLDGKDNYLDIIESKTREQQQDIEDTASKVIERFSEALRQIVSQEINRLQSAVVPSRLIKRIIIGCAATFMAVFCFMLWQIGSMSKAKGRAEALENEARQELHDAALWRNFKADNPKAARAFLQAKQKE